MLLLMFKNSRIENTLNTKIEYIRTKLDFKIKKTKNNSNTDVKALILKFFEIIWHQNFFYFF